MEFHIEYWEQSTAFGSSWFLDSTFLDLGEAQKVFEKNENDSRTQRPRLIESIRRFKWINLNLKFLIPIRV